MVDVVIDVGDPTVEIAVQNPAVLISTNPQGPPGPPGSSILTTKGDLLTFDTAEIRFPIGTDGQFLKANSVQPEGIEWDTVNADDLPIAAPVGLSAGGANVTGVALTFNRSDHEHAIPAAAPVGTGTANAEGVALTFSRSDHVHALSPHAASHSDGGSDEITVEDLATGSVVVTEVLQPDGAGGLAFGALAVASLPAHASTHENGGSDEIDVTGLSGLLADAQTPLGHAASHLPSGSDPLTTAVPGAAVDAGDAAAEGVAESFARSDHQHAVSTGTPGAIEPDDAAAEGVATDLARSDHTHAIVAATAVELTDSSNAEGVATSFARSDHTHAHGNRGGGSLHALVVASGAAGFMSGADKATFDAHLNPIDTTNPHLVTITQAYVAGGGVTALNTTQGAFDVDGAALGTGTAGNNDGPDYFSVLRGATNVLCTSYNSVDGTALVYSNAILGLDIGPDPALFPNRSTITIRPDLLLFLKEDRAFGVGPGSGFFNWLSDITITGGGSAGGFVSLDGRIIFDGVDASGFGMGNALRAAIDWVGVDGTNLGPGFVFAGNNTFIADGGATLAPQTRIYLDNSTYDTANGGTLTTGAIGHNSLFSFLTVNAGCTISLRRGLFMQDATGAGAITTQIGIDIDALNFATTNIGIRVQMNSGDGDVWNTVGFTGAMRLGGELEVDGDLNHDGANAGFRGVAPVALSAAYTPTNVTPDRAFDADAPTLNELADVVGTIIADLQAQGLLG